MKWNKRGLIIFLVFFILINIFSIQMTKGIIKTANKPYKGIVIALDAGHGGFDSGARFSGIEESGINLSIAKKLKSQLEQLGMKVILTREDDNDLADADAKVRKRQDMKRRIEIINKKEVDLFISIHLNSFADKSVKGAQIFYNKKNKDSLQFAKFIQKEVSEVSDSDMLIKNGDYYILNQSKKIGVLLECGFLSNPIERKKLNSGSYQDKLARSIKKGIMEFLRSVYE